MYFYILYIFQFHFKYLLGDEYKDFFNKFKSEFFSKNKNDNNPPEKIVKKIKNEKINSFSFSVEERYQILNLKNCKIINVNLKSTINNTLYDVSINNTEKISELKQQLIKKNDNYKNNNIILIYSGKILKDDDYINSYRIKNGDCILFLLK